MRVGCTGGANPDIKNPPGDYLSRRGYPFAEMQYIPIRYAGRGRGGKVRAC